MSRGVWRTLGLTATRDQTAIRRAYAARLRVTNPEDDPEGFKTLRGAYDQAMALARGQAARDHRGQGEPAVIAIAETPAVAASEEPADPAILTADPPRPDIAAPAQPDAREAALDDLNLLTGRLHALVVDEGPVDTIGIHAAGEALLRSPALDEISVHGRVETWLQDLIACNLPRTDCLIDPSVAHFRWQERSGRLETPGAVEHILLRQDDVVYRRRLRARDHLHNRAFRLLEKPPRPRSPIWRLRTIINERRVRAFFDNLNTAHPTLHADLDPGSAAWWREHFQGPRIGVRSLMAVLAVGAVAFLIGLPASSLFGGGLVGGVLHGLIFGGLAAGLILARFYAIDMARHHWRRDWRDAAPDWIRLGWAPASLAVLLLAGLAPPGTASTLIAVSLALAVLVWARTVAGERPGRLDLTDAYGPLIWANGYLFPFWLVGLHQLSFMHGLQVAVPLIVAGLAFSRSLNALAAYWSGLAVRLRLGLLASAGGLAALAALSLVLAGENVWLQALAVALIGVVAVASRTPAEAHPLPVLRVRYIANGVLIVAVIMAGPMLLLDYHGSSWLVMFGGVLLLGAAISLAISAVAERGR
ncbi:MAG: hypothetical protein Q8L66_14420 [Caulobacter sp.]|nr:hypothetical protein [Caulobacter sp.]